MANPFPMLAMRLLAKRQRRAFTLIELLVVVVIIGILASIALPSFVGAQDKARNSSVTGNVNTIRMALEQYSTDNNGAFPANASMTSTTAGSGLLAAGNSYLPGNKLPRAPWSTSPQDADVAIGSFETAANAAAGSALGLAAGGGTKGIGFAFATGAVKATKPAAQADYGAITYNYDTNTQTYVLYGTGKKNKDAIIAAQTSNNGN